MKLKTLAISTPTDHIVLLVPGGDRPQRFLMDTGASFNILRGEAYGPLNLAEISEKVDEDLDALVGYPYLKELTFYINWKEKHVKYRKEFLTMSTGIDADRRKGLITFPVVLVHENPQQSLGCLFDSGAKISYIHSKYITDKDRPVEERDDFYPFFGDFKTELYRKTVEINGQDIVLHFGVLPEDVEHKLMNDRTDIEMILGTEICKYYKVVFSMSRNIFKLFGYKETIPYNEIRADDTK